MPKKSIYDLLDDAILQYKKPKPRPTQRVTENDINQVRRLRSEIHQDCSSRYIRSMNEAGSSIFCDKPDDYRVVISFDPDESAYDFKAEFPMEVKEILCSIGDKLYPLPINPVVQLQPGDSFTIPLGDQVMKVLTELWNKHQEEENKWV